MCGKRDDCSLTARGQRPQEGWGRRQTENGGGGTRSGLWKRKRRDRRMRRKGRRGEETTVQWKIVKHWLK